MNPAEFARSKHCSRRDCLGIGQFFPVLVINTVGQTAVERPVTLGLAIRLCRRCKEEFRPAMALTPRGRHILETEVMRKRHRKLNWDTLRVEWRSAETAANQIMKPISDKLQ